MLDMEEVTAALTSSAGEDTGAEKEVQKESGSHAELMCEILMKMGRLEAKLDMLLDYELMEPEESESESESMESGKELATNPALYSNQLEFDIPPIF